MKACSTCCVEKEVSCPIEECRLWIEYEEDLNCSLISIKKHGNMTLREVARRLNISFVRVKQIEDKAVGKLNSGCKFK